MIEVLSIVALFFLPSAIAWEACHECRPLELMEAPGIGFDLTMGYGASAIKYRNGTSRSLVKIDGAEGYQAIMRSYAEDARRARLDLPRNRPSIYSEQVLVMDQLPDDRKPRLTVFASLVARVKSRLGFAIQTLPPAPPEDDAEIKVIEGLVRQLKAESETLIGVPINHTMLSLPSYFPLSRPDVAQFVEANRRIGIRPLRHLVIRAFQPFHNMTGCPEHWDPYLCDYPDIRQAVVSYDQAALSISFLSTSSDDTELWEMFVDLGSGCHLRDEAPEKYWEEVATKLLDFLRPDTMKSLTSLILHGESATDHRFLQVMNEVFGSNEALRPETYIHSPEEHLFAAAHEAAGSARGGMEDGFLACIGSDYCPVPKDEL